MKVIFTQNQKDGKESFQARSEQSLSTGDSHGDFCVTAYGATREEALANLRQLALRMARELDLTRGV